MKITRALAIVGGITLGGLAGAALQFNSASAALPSRNQSLVAAPTASPSPSPACPPMRLAIAFTSNVANTSSLHLHLPWGRPGDTDGRMIEDYGAFNGQSIASSSRCTT